MAKDVQLEDVPKEFLRLGRSPTKDVEQLLVAGSPDARGAWERLSAICGKGDLYDFLMFFVQRIVWKGPFKMPPETVKGYVGESERRLGGLAISVEKLAERLGKLGEIDFWRERWSTHDPLPELMKRRALELKQALAILRQQLGETSEDLLVTQHEAEFLTFLKAKSRSKEFPWTDVAILERAACQAWLGQNWFGKYAPSFEVGSLKRRVTHHLDGLSTNS